ncbi:MAG: NAD(P)H-dependent oxidoreductase [Desulfotignum sp.]|nr:NAD(P)H-dependent oxidoreductase [Desulfotignum sp.]
MKVLAINSSARIGGESKTEFILDFLVKGMKEEGAEVEVVNIFKKKINYCIGCFTCWSKTPGECVHKDDMTKDLFPRYMASDLCIMATPLFHYTLNANMKTFIERTLPFVLPFFELREGVTTHPLRQVPPPVVAVSVAGFPEYSVFEQLSSYMHYLYGKHLRAEIYIPGAENLVQKTRTPLVKKVLDAVIQGGRELIKNKKISAGTMELINTPTSDFKTMATLGNAFWQTCIDEGVTPKEFYKRNMVPRPNSLESFLTLMKEGFNPEKADGFKGCCQFVFSGKHEGTCYYEIKNNEIHCGMGSASQPDITITTPFEVWMDILTKKADGAEMFMAQKYTVEGDLDLLIKSGEFFGK